MKQLVEDAIPKVFSELDPHSVYIPAKDAQRANEDLEGSFSGIQGVVDRDDTVKLGIKRIFSRLFLYNL